MTFKLKRPKRRVNEKMTLEALHKSAEIYREMYDNIRKKEDILQKQLKIAVEVLSWYDGLKSFLIGRALGIGKMAHKALKQIKELEK